MKSAPLKIAVTGPESSGKSTLCAALAQTLHTTWVPEYARAYLTRNSKVNVTAQEELKAIATGQIAAEDAAAIKANTCLICDTDLHNIRIWSETMYNSCHRYILETIAIRKYDLCILSYPDIPWQPDPLRGYPDLKDRHYFYQQYLDAVMAGNAPFIIIRGTHEQRMETALTAISEILNPKF